MNRDDGILITTGKHGTVVLRFYTSQQLTDEVRSGRPYHGVHGVVILLAVLVVEEEHLHSVPRVNLTVPSPGDVTKQTKIH